MGGGAGSLMAPAFQVLAAGMVPYRRHSNLLGGGGPVFRAFPTSDGGYVAGGALEPQFYARLLELLGLDRVDRPHQMDPAGWPILTSDLAAAFASQPRNHWEQLFSGQDACVTPVLSLEEAPHHEQNQARNTFMTDTSTPIPAPAPRFSRTASAAGEPVSTIGAHTAQVLAEYGLVAEEIESLAADGTIEVAS